MQGDEDEGAAMLPYRRSRTGVYCGRLLAGTTLSERALTGSSREHLNVDGTKSSAHQVRWHLVSFHLFDKHNNKNMYLSTYVNTVSIVFLHAMQAIHCPQERLM